MIYILYINCILYILSTPWETLFSLDHGLRGRLNFKSVISYKVQFMERSPLFSFYPLSLFDFPQRISGGDISYRIHRSFLEKNKKWFLAHPKLSQNKFFDSFKHSFCEKSKQRGKKKMTEIVATNSIARQANRLDGNWLQY